MKQTFFSKTVLQKFIIKNMYDTSIKIIKPSQLIPKISKEDFLFLLGQKKIDV